MNKIFHSRIILVGLTLLILLITLYFGLRFKGFRLENHVSRLQNETGIHFERFGIAYAKIENQDNPSSLKNFTIEIALGAGNAKTHGFDLIMTVCDGKDTDQLIIGQWQSHLVIMNGDDYSNKRKIKRISAEIFTKPYTNMMLTVTTGEKGTALFMNGELINSRPDLHLMLPGGKEAMLTLGNSVSGNSSWSGSVYGFALYGHSLTQEKIKRHYQEWKETARYQRLRDENPLLFFDFDGKKINRFSGSEKGMPALKIPEYFPVLEKQILSAPWKGISFNKNSIIDITINLLGFIPLGFILYALFTNLFSVSQNRIMFFSVLLCFLMSLFIEITQAWIPSRSSQSLDLMLNTAGGLIGSYVARSIARSVWRKAGKL